MENRKKDIMKHEKRSRSVNICTLGILKKKYFLKKNFFSSKGKRKSSDRKSSCTAKKNCKKNPKYILVKFKNINSNEKF